MRARAAPYNKAVHLGRLSRRPAEHAVTAHRREQEYAVIQVVDMGSLHEQVHIGDEVGHDEEHVDAREQEHHQRK